VAEWQRGRRGRSGGGGRGAADLMPAAVVLLAALTLAACSHRPPPDFAPDPGLVGQIQSIRIYAPPTACPGQTIHVSYDAVLDDGSVVRFANTYDSHHPPRLHVVFLTRYSPDALALESGDWDLESDPLLSATQGFKLRVSMHAKPSVFATTTVAPDYSCANHVFRFEGPSGRTGEAGGPGPDVTVRLAVGHSPYVAKLLVAGIQVGVAPPFYVLADADQVPPSDWLVVESRGGRGGRGEDGADGAQGTKGAPGCPGSAGGAGGAGGNGGVGAPGGPGGHITVIAPAEDAFLAGIVDARSTGGDGGPGGRAGAGGKGGKGGAASSSDSRRCAAGADGPEGPAGTRGRAGRDGSPGLRAQVITVPQADVFGTAPPPELAALINSHSREQQ